MTYMSIVDSYRPPWKYNLQAYTNTIGHKKDLKLIGLFRSDDLVATRLHAMLSLWEQLVAIILEYPRIF